MKSSTLIVWLLVAACIAIDLAMIGELQVRRNEWPGAGGIIGLGLVFSQIALLALWVACGKKTLVIRAVSALLGVWGVSCVGSYSATGGLGEVRAWFGLLILCSLASLAPIIVAKINRYDLIDVGSETVRLPTTRLTSSQFTIWGLLTLMTGVGITLMLLRNAAFPWLELLQAAPFFAIFVFTGCAVLLLTLTVAKLRWAFIATIVICPIAGFLLSLHHAVAEQAPELILAVSIESLGTIFAAIGLRSGGVRLVRSPPRFEAKASGSSDVSVSGSEGRVDEL
jgi:hypothetical protein